MHKYVDTKEFAKVQRTNRTLRMVEKLGVVRWTLDTLNQRHIGENGVMALAY